VVVNIRGDARIGIHSTLGKCLRVRRAAKDHPSTSDSAVRKASVAHGAAASDEFDVIAHLLGG
jgi:hypothetical protein